MQLSRITPAVAAGLAFAGGLAAILTAWGFQILGGYAPCKLCLEQRVPYYIGLPLALLALILIATGRARALAMLLLLAVAAVFLYGAGLGIYQSGAEWGFWAGPADCGGGAAIPSSAAGMLNALQSTRVVSCTGSKLAPARAFLRRVERGRLGGRCPSVTGRRARPSRPARRHGMRGTA